MIVRDFDDMRLGLTPLSKLYYGHDLIWKREDEESDTLIITTIPTDIFTIPSINPTTIVGTVDFGDGESSSYNNTPIVHNYPYSNSWKIKIKAPFTTIKSNSFSGSGSREYIQSVVVPKGVTLIENSAFSGINNLISVILPNSVLIINSYAFAYSNSLTTITIPDSVTTIGTWAFRGCRGLTSVTLSNSMTRISDSTFLDCSMLTSVTIPNSITTIGGRAFGSCSSLESITIPDSITSIESLAFSSCTSLASIIIPPSVKSIGTLAFGNTALTSVTIAEDCTYASNSFPPNCVINRY